MHEIGDMEEYRAFVSGMGVRVIDMWAPWCGPCRAFAPAFQEVAEEMTEDGIVFAKCDVDANQDIAIAEAVMSIPTVVVYRDGTVLERLIGAMPADVLRHEIRNLL